MSDFSAWGTFDVTSAKGAGDENFPVGSHLIAKRLRPHVHAYYAFARAVDDIADTTRLSPDEKVARLDAMEAVVRGSADAPPGRLDAASALRLRETFRQTGVSVETATDLLIAFRQDARQSRYQSWEGLMTYCRYSAAPVGRFLLALHGEDEALYPASDALCASLQVLNHLQDCAQDLKVLDRCYLPLPWLADEEVHPSDLLLVRAKPGLRRVFDRVLDGVDRLNAQAATLAPRVRDRRIRMETAVIMTLAYRLTARLRREDPILDRVSLGRGDAARALIAGAMSLPNRLSA